MEGSIYYMDSMPDLEDIGLHIRINMGSFDLKFFTVSLETMTIYFPDVQYRSAYYTKVIL